MTARAVAVPGGTTSALGAWMPVLLVWSCLLVLPFGRAVEVPVLCMTAAGILLMVRRRSGLLELPGLRTFALVFAAMWLPMALSLPDAVNHERTTVVVVNHLRFAFSGVFIIWALSRPRAPQQLLMLCGALMAFWVVDALVQLVFGADLIGRKPTGQRLSGLFGAESRKLGTTLGVLAPLLWVWVQRRSLSWMLWLAVGASVFVVLAAGARAGWVSVAVCGAAFCWANRAFLLRHRARMLGVAVVLLVVLPAVAYYAVPSVTQRVDQSISELTGQKAVTSSPLGHRVWIWKGAVSMITHNPINGVGARGFRYAFPDYAAPGDPFVNQLQPIYPTHSHQLLLEIASETGLIGIVGLVVGLSLLVRAARSAGTAARSNMAPYAMAVCAAFFPFNTHLAIYSSHWSQLVWWLVAVYCGCIAGARDPTSGDETGAPDGPG